MPSSDDNVGGTPAQLHWVDQEIGWILIGAAIVGVVAAYLVRRK